MNEHTPGEWKVSKAIRNKGRLVARVATAGIYTTERVDFGDDWKTRREADAHLIAAAPSLLAACELVERWLTWAPGTIYLYTMEEILLTIQKALAKARGSV